MIGAVTARSLRALTPLRLVRHSSDIPTYSPHPNAHQNPVNPNQSFRTFTPTDTYSPANLSRKNHDAYKHMLSKNSPADVFAESGRHPLREWKNVALMSSFVSQMGWIMPRRTTGLSKPNQRHVSKAIKRAKSMGTLFLLFFGVFLSGRFFGIPGTHAAGHLAEHLTHSRAIHATEESHSLTLAHQVSCHIHTNCYHQCTIQQHQSAPLVHQSATP